MNESSGFTLVEMMIVVLIIGFVLSMGFMLFLFGVSSQQIGEEQADVQQNARLVGDFISKELRMAEKCDILYDYAEYTSTEDLKIFLEGIGYDFEEDHHVYFIFEDGGSIYYQEVIEGDERAELLEGISRNIDFDLEFKLGDKDNTVEIEIYATDKQTGRSYYLETEVLALNVDKIAVDEDIADGDGGTAIVYQIPAPPEPSMRIPSINPSSMIYGSNDSIEVTVRTERVDDGKSVTAEFRKDDRQDPIDISLPDDLEIQNDLCTFTFDLPDLVDKGLFFGNDYYVKVEVDTVRYSRSSFFRVLPAINVEIEPHSAAHLGNFIITTQLVPDDTLVEVELLDSDDGPVVFTMQDPAPTNNDNDLIIQNNTAEFRIHSDDMESDLTDDLSLRITIGNKIKEIPLAPFHVKSIDISPSEEGEPDDSSVEIVTDGNYDSESEKVIIIIKFNSDELNYVDDFILKYYGGVQYDSNEILFGTGGSLEPFYIELVDKSVDGYYGKDLSMILYINDTIDQDNLWHEENFVIDNPN